MPAIDAMTGPVVGRPKSATFRTIDISGLDVLTAVAQNLSETLDAEDDRRAFRLPPFVFEMVARGWLGEKTGQGFYRRERTADGRARILALDPAAMEYRPIEPTPLPEMERGLAIAEPGDRVRTLFLDAGRVGTFLRETLAPTLIYTSRVALDIAHSIDDVDRAMRWGFGWELGPFELMDAIGVREVVAAAGGTSSLVADALQSGRNCIRRAPPPEPAAGLLLLKAATDRGRIVSRNPAASLVDLDDGVLAIEFHSKLNIIGSDKIGRASCRERVYVLV